MYISKWSWLPGPVLVLDIDRNRNASGANKYSYVMVDWYPSGRGADFTVAMAVNINFTSMSQFIWIAAAVELYTMEFLVVSFDDTCLFVGEDMFS